MTSSNVKGGTEAVHLALIKSRIVVKPGQGHFATGTAPELFAREVLDFLAEPND